MFVETVQTVQSAFIDTMAQLDDTFELKIDKIEVTDTGQQDKVVIESVVNELIDAVVNQEEHGAGDAADADAHHYVPRHQESIHMPAKKKLRLMILGKILFTFTIT